ncbi:uncharacterized protein LOC106670106 isoform X13 [Cimex lectularius]|uniref:Uncharacterized protein n=1 Tax=Cimex lectularius TaxID=79782 RepID=A0A8I6S018_CIMLE|nr:uncharacterized protein LOC106670106 isoform X13 [Cimex lectularius]
MDNTISPAMQKKLQEIAELQNILTNKLNEFAKLNENPKEIEEESLILRTELEEIKQISSTDSEETDREIEEKLKVVNERIERIAKAAIKAQEEVIMKYKNELEEVKNIAKQIKVAINACDLPEERKRKIENSADAFINNAEFTKDNLENILVNLKSNFTIDDQQLLNKEQAVKAVEKLIEKLKRIF